MRKYSFPLSVSLTLVFLSACTTPNILQPLKNIPNPLPFVSMPNIFNTNVKKEYFTGGKLRSEFIMSDKTGQNGLLKKYGYNGKLTSSVQIHRGIKHGTETLFSPNGRILKETPYQNNRKEGTLKAYYPNGDIMATITYVNDLKHGKATKYNRDGSINQEATFQQGRLSN